MKLISDKSRRIFLARGLLTLSGMAFLSCSGGNSGSSSPPVVTHPLGTPDQGGIGSLIYRNSSRVGVYNFESLSNIEFETAPSTFAGIGISASKSGLIVTTEKGNAEDVDFFIVIYGPDGNLRQRIAIQRFLSFPTSAITYSPDEKYLAFTVDERSSATSRRRHKRTLVYDLTANQVITQFDDFEDPVWIAQTGELVLRQSDSGVLNVFSSAFADQGRFGNIEVTTRIASYDVSPDGQFVVWEDGQVIYAYDRNTELQWTAVEDRLSSIYSPLFAPNGRLLAVQGRKTVTYCPHIVPFVKGTTVNLESDIHALTNNTLAETLGRMGWYV